MEKTEKLTRILKRLNCGEEPFTVRRDERDFLCTVDALDLSIAEQQLLTDGVSSAELRDLCKIHLQVMDSQADAIRHELSEDHVISILMREHETILCFLDDLELITEKILGLDSYHTVTTEFYKLGHIAEHLVSAELHYQREEDVLFPELERRDVYGPVTVMKEEHKLLRQRKKQLKELADNVAEMDFGEFKCRLKPIVEFIVPTLRDHIMKEDNILYPTAVSVIDDDAVWSRLRSECDRIGYCCFVPVK